MESLDSIFSKARVVHDPSGCPSASLHLRLTESGEAGVADGEQALQVPRMPVGFAVVLAENWGHIS
jgi:hypothetical protein